MASSCFTDKTRAPSEAEVAKRLGAMATVWRKIRAEVAKQAPGITEEWGYTSASTGWGLRLKSGKRVILYLTPGEGKFFASMALGEKAANSESAQRMPAALRRLIDAAPRYAEGRGVRLQVTKASDAGAVARLVALKVT
jgi:hypothetical protein